MKVAFQYLVRWLTTPRDTPTKTRLLLEFCTKVGMALHSHTIHDFLSQYRLGNVSTYLDLHQQVFDTLEQQKILENRNTGSALVSSDKIDIIKTLNALVELCEVCRRLNFPTMEETCSSITMIPCTAIQILNLKTRKIKVVRTSTTPIPRRNTLTMPVPFTEKKSWIINRTMKN